MSGPWMFTGVAGAEWSPAEIHHHQFFSFPLVDLEVVPLAPVQKVLREFPVLLVVLISDEADDCRVIGELLQVTSGRVEGKVCSIKAEEERSQERRQDRSLRGPCTADSYIGLTVPGPQILWTFSEVIQNPVCEVVVHPGVLHLVPQKCRLYGVESTGEIKEHDLHSTSRFLLVRESSMLEEDNSVIHSNARLVGKREDLRCGYLTKALPEK